jgi:Putative auto-transporter adhesin, head GIN domain
MKFLFSLCLCACLMSCNSDAQSSQTQTETRNLAAFTKLSNAGSWDIDLKEGDSESVFIQAKNTKLSEIITEVQNGTLKIYRKSEKMYDYNEKSKVKLTITYKSLNSINCAGSGDLYARTPIRAPELMITMSGSGDVAAEIQTDNLDLNISGSGDFTLSGEAKQQHINISGSGDVNGKKLRGDKAKVNVSGSGDVTLAVKDIQSNVSGSGEVKQY